MKEKTQVQVTPESSSSHVLEMTDISKSFGATLALESVSLQVAAGSVHALIGENGAGKSTLMKILSGAIFPDRGNMRVEGIPFAPKNPADGRGQGVAMIYQELTLAPHLNAVDNICLGREFQQYGFVSQTRQKSLVREVLSQLGCEHLDLRAPVSEFSVGEQQLLEIGRALAYDARIIIFDEPTSSLTQKDSEKLFSIIDGLKERGLGLVYISHFLEEIRRVADAYTVLRDGRQVGSGSLDGVSEKEIVNMMVGREVDELFPRVEHEIGDPVLSLENLSGVHIPADVTFDLRQGEVLGFSGLVGAGRTELLRAIYGLDPVSSGKISLIGSQETLGTPGRSIQNGLAMVSEDRKTEGLAQDQSIGENITYSRLGQYSYLGLIRRAQRRKRVQESISEMEIKAASQDDPVSSLSGGNQQKVAIARVLHQEADIYLLDEPTRGIDVGTKSEIYRIIGELASRGKSIIVVSSYLPELMAICDRIAVMSRGRIRELRDVDDWTEHDVMMHAVTTEN
ncbi:MAG: sugar ABC transporter ATP-binding protein [Planctomycetota bacterium]|nr:sugar ABC transporter ATP-binding protein [Planctomycetota bacterium]